MPISFGTIPNIEGLSPSKWNAASEPSSANEKISIGK